MPVSLKHLRASMARTAPAGREPRWNELLGEFVSATAAPLTREVERLLLEILRFDGELQLDESTEMPHRMSPEEMLKSLAAQALGRWTGAEYVPTLRRLEAASSPALSCMVRGVVQKALSEKARAPRGPEAVAEIRSQEAASTVRYDYDADGHAEVTERELGGRAVPVPLRLWRLCGMAFISDVNGPGGQPPQNGYEDAPWPAALNHVREFAGGSV